MSDIVDRLRAFCIDWDGSAMGPGDLPMDGLHCAELLEAADLITELRKQLAEAQEWRPIETAPKDGTYVLMTGGKPGYGWYRDETPPAVVGQFLSGEGPNGVWQFAWYDSGWYGEYENPTHWQPLPEPPALANTEEGG